MKIPDIIFSAGLDRALGWTVLHAIWQVTLIAFIAGILLLALRQKSAQLRYWVANLAMISVLFSAIATFSWYLQTTPEVVVQTSSAPGPGLAAGTTTAVPVLTTEKPALHPETVSNTVAFSDYFSIHLPLIVLIWFVGMGIFLLRLLGGLLQVYDLRQRMNFHADPYWTDLLNQLAQKSGLRRGITLLESALVRSPLTIGHLRPLILFPIGMINRLSEQEVEAILAHELAHILRRDYLFNILQNFIEALFYFHPAIWWLSAQVRNEREHACDDRAIALLGNKINYAKALVVVQEMAFFPQSAALAFAGTHKGQLLKRVQRLLFQPKKSFNIMEKWISTGLVVCLVFMLAFGQRFNNNTHNQDLTEIADNSRNSGIWEATFGSDSVQLTLSSRDKNNHWMMGDDYPKSSFSNLNVANGETTFFMSRPAGKITFTGKIENNTGYGRFEFAPDESYRAALTQQGISPADDNLLLHCFLAEFPSNYVTAIQKMGLGQIDKEKLEQLAVFRLDEPAIKKYHELAASIGQKSVSFDELIQLKVSNVTKETAESLAKSGLKNLDLEALSQLSMHGVNAKYIAELKAQGLDKLTSEEILSAKIHGVDADFIRETQRLGMGKLDLEQILNMKIQNLDSAFISQLPTMGFENITVDEMMALKIHGVDADFVKKAQSMGLGKLGFEEVMAMKIHNIDEAFVNKAQNMGLGKLGFDDVMTLKIHNIDEDFVKKAQNMGFGKLGMDEVMTMKIHHIDADFLAECKKMDLGTLSFEDLVSIRIHGITQDFVQSFRKLDFKNLNVEDLMAAKIHGITPEFIREAGQKGYKFPNLSEYVELKMRMDRKQN